MYSIFDYFPSADDSSIFSLVMWVERRLLRMFDFHWITHKKSHNWVIHKRILCWCDERDRRNDVRCEEEASKGCCWFCHLGIKIKFLVGDRKEVKILEISNMWVMKNLIKRIFQISANDWSYVTYKMLTLLKILAAKYYQNRHKVDFLKIPYFF